MLYPFGPAPRGDASRFVLGFSTLGPDPATCRTRTRTSTRDAIAPSRSSE